MNVIYIVLAITGYVFMGLFTGGFIGLDLSEEQGFAMTVVFAIIWPLVWAGYLMIVIFAAPIRLGRRVGKKYLSVVTNTIDKCINGDG